MTAQVPIGRVGFTLDDVGAQRVSKPNRVLSLLKAARGHPVAISELLHAVDIGSVPSLRMHISQLRKELGEDARHLRTIRSFGYLWDAPPEAADHRPRTPGPEHRSGPELCLDTVQCHVVIGGDRFLELSVRQTRILKALSHEPGQILSIRLLRRDTGVSSTRSIINHVNDLRRALLPLQRPMIRSVRGLGYQYIGPYLPLVPQAAHNDNSQPVMIGELPDGGLQVDWHLMRLREAERRVLAVLVMKLGSPVSYGDLMDQAGLLAVTTLRSAIAALHAVLADSDITIVHCGEYRRAYMLVRSSTHAKEHSDRIAPLAPSRLEPA